MPFAMAVLKLKLAQLRQSAEEWQLRCAAQVREAEASKLGEASQMSYIVISKSLQCTIDEHIKP